jgi:molybdopterin-guanine dinucleotide biosynthesis protein
MPIHRSIALLLTVAASALVSSANVLAEPLQQTTQCPVASNDVMSAALGTPVQLLDPDFGVTVNGSDTECLFMAGGQMVLVRRTGEYFVSSQATPDSIEQLRQLVADDLDYVPVQGVGNAAFWATVRDRSLAPERMGVLISQQGTDALAVGVMDTPEALARATALTQAVVAAQTP